MKFIYFSRQTWPLKTRIQTRAHFQINRIHSFKKLPNSFKKLPKGLLKSWTADHLPLKAEILVLHTLQSILSKKNWPNKKKLRKFWLCPRRSPPDFWNKLFFCVSEHSESKKKIFDPKKKLGNFLEKNSFDFFMGLGGDFKHIFFHGP